MAENGLSTFDGELETFNDEKFPGINDPSELEDDLDALNDETFGAATTEDWESAHEQLAMLDNGFFDTSSNDTKYNKNNQTDLSKNANQTYMMHQLENNLSNERNHVMPNARGSAPNSASKMPPGLTETFFNLYLGATSTPFVERLNQTNNHMANHLSTTLPNQLINQMPNHLNNNLPMTSLIDNISQVPSSVSQLNNNNWNMGQNTTQIASNLNDFNSPNLNQTNSLSSSNMSKSKIHLEDIENSIFSKIYGPSCFNNELSSQSIQMNQTQSTQTQAQRQINAPIASALPPTNSSFATFDAQPMQQNNVSQLINESPVSSAAGRKIFKLEELEKCQIDPTDLFNKTVNKSNSQLSELESPSGKRTPNAKYNQRKGQFSNNSSNTSVRYCPNPLNPLEMIKVEEPNHDRYDINFGGNNYHRNRHSQRDNRNRNYSYGQYNNANQANTNQDEYAGLMTRREIEWLKKVSRKAIETNNPYVQDYYYVTYQTRKIAAQMMRKEKDSGQNRNIPTLIIPDRSTQLNQKENNKNTNYTPINVEGSLGKLQVSNVNCPRKLLDFNNKLERLQQQQESCHDPLANIETRSEVNKFRETLLEIEKNYGYILDIDLEDKRMAALPEAARAPHIARRAELCDMLFRGILTTEDLKHLNLSIANIRKGCMLLFRAIQLFQDASVKAMCISELLNVNNFHYVVMQKDKTLYCIDYGQILVDAIKTIRDCDFDLLLQIANGLDDASIIAKFQCGQEIIEVLVNQYHEFSHVTESQKEKWINFLNRIHEDLEEIPNLKNLCLENLFKLSN